MSEGLEVQTVRVKPTGRVRVAWREKFGQQSLTVQVDPSIHDRDREVRLEMERRWGPVLGDVRTERLAMSRAGAIKLRDALDAALAWEPEESTDD